MASISQFEEALTAKKVTIDRFRLKDMTVTKAYGSIGKHFYYWLGSGICFSESGVRKPLLDLEF